MRFSRCRNVRLEGFHDTNPGSWACHLRNCDGVKVKGTSCFNYCNKMNDGLDIESCNVTVEDCDFYADDDSFCFKAESDKSFPVTNVVVRNCRMGSICNAIKFGTGSYNAFRDITVENCELRRSPGAWRWDWRKRWMPGVTNRYCGIAGLALEVVDGGRMENVTIRNITMEGYMTPIFIRHSNRHGPKGKGNTYLRNILIENVTGTCDGRIASSITGVPPRDGMPARRPSNITLRNISLVAPPLREREGRDGHARRAARVLHGGLFAERNDRRAQEAPVARDRQVPRVQRSACRVLGGGQGGRRRLAHAEEPRRVRRPPSGTTREVYCRHRRY